MSKPYRVHLVASISAHIDVLADTPEEAEALASELFDSDDPRWAYDQECESIEESPADFEETTAQADN